MLSTDLLNDSIKLLMLSGFWNRLTYTGLRITQRTKRVLVVLWLAQFTLSAHAVVSAVITHTTTDLPRSYVTLQVKVTLLRVAITVAPCNKV